MVPTGDDDMSYIVEMVTELDTLADKIHEEMKVLDRVWDMVDLVGEVESAVYNLQMMPNRTTPHYYECQSMTCTAKAVKDRLKAELRASNIGNDIARYWELVNEYQEAAGEPYYPERGEHPPKYYGTGNDGGDAIEPSWDAVSRG